MLSNDLKNRAIRIYPPSTVKEPKTALYYFEDLNHTIYWDLAGTPSVDEFIQTAEAGKDFVRELARRGIACNWLNDAKDFIEIESGAVTSLNEILNKPFNELAKELNTFFRVAFIEPSSPVGKVGVFLYKNLTNASNQFRKTLEIESFNSTDEAFQWFAQPKKVKLIDQFFNFFHLSH